MNNSRGDKIILQKLLNETSVVIEITSMCSKESFLADDIKKRAT